MLPGLEDKAVSELNFDNVPTLKKLIMFNTEEEITNVMNFDSLFNAGGSTERNIVESVKIE